MGKVRKDGGCKDVWGRCGKVYGVSVGSVLRCGECEGRVMGGVGKVRKDVRGVEEGKGRCGV